MSQFRPPPPPSLSEISRALTGSPKDGDERTVPDKDGIKHLEFFGGGSWRHDREQCRARINPICNRE
jgi:hypothetical protein